MSEAGVEGQLLSPGARTGAALPFPASSPTPPPFRFLLDPFMTRDTDSCALQATPTNTLGLLTSNVTTATYW